MANRLTHESADTQVFAAMKEPASLKVQRFREMIAQRGGRAEEPFGQEKEAREPRISIPERLPARTTI